MFNSPEHIVVVGFCVCLDDLTIYVVWNFYVHVIGYRMAETMCVTTIGVAKSLVSQLRR